MITEAFLPGMKFTKIKKLVTILCLCTAVLCSACRPKPWKLEDKGDVQGLIAMLSDSSDTLERRTYAASSLGRIGSPLAVDPLIQAMQDFFEQETALVLAGNFNDDNCGPITSAVSATATALGKIGDPRAVEPLNAVLEIISEQAIQECAKHDVEEAVVRALVALGDKKAEELLITRLVEGLDAYCWAVDRENCSEWRELQALGEPVIEKLMELLPAWRYQEDNTSYSRALDILAGGTDPRIRGALEAEFEDTGSTEAMEALGRFLKFDTDQLLPYLESEKTLTMYKLLIKIGEPGTEAALVAALDKFGTEAMADYYVVCGGTTAVWEAGREWWWEKGFDVQLSKPTSPFGSSDPCGWGVGP